jgi:transcriptional regulator with XRE-family HTH domain
MEEVRRLRLEKGWNQNELAYHAKVAPSVISLIETGKREPNATTLRKLAEALDVDVPDLFGRTRHPKAQAPLPFDEDEQLRISELKVWQDALNSIANTLEQDANVPDAVPPTEAETQHARNLRDGVMWMLREKVFAGFEDERHSAAEWEQVHQLLEAIGHVHGAIARVTDDQEGEAEVIELEERFRAS